MFCALGPTRLDVNTKAKNAMGAKRVSFASREEAEQVTNQIYTNESSWTCEKIENIY